MHTVFLSLHTVKSNFASIHWFHKHAYYLWNYKRMGRKTQKSHIIIYKLWTFTFTHYFCSSSVLAGDYVWWRLRSAEKIPIILMHWDQFHAVLTSGHMFYFGGITSLLWALEVFLKSEQIFFFFFFPCYIFFSSHFQLAFLDV